MGSHRLVSLQDMQENLVCLAVSTEPSAFNVDVMFYVPNLNFLVC